MRTRRSLLRPGQPAPSRGHSEARVDLRPFVPSEATPWDAPRARHLLRRLTLGARPADVAALLDRSPADAVDRIFDAALARPSLPEPSWLSLRRPPRGQDLSAYNAANGAALKETYIGAFNRLLGDGLANRYARLGEATLERLTVFWSTHYVTEQRTHGTSTWLFRYRSLLRDHALGRVPDLLHAMGTEPAMLRYLDGNRNTKNAPNENYARELLELFSMGITGPDGTANYTQADIVDLARMLTGWKIDQRTPDPVRFEPNAFDNGPKTVFGRTGDGVETYDDVVPLLFAERSPQIAHFIATKLYTAYVAATPPAGIVEAIATRLQASDFAIEPVLRALIQSAHFFDAANVGAIIKSPVEVILGSAYAFGLDAVDADSHGRFRYQARDLGQDLFNPPDVKGWRTGEAWINTSTITERAKRARNEVWRNRAAIEADALARASAFNPQALARDLYIDLLTHPPADADLDDLTEILLEGTPAYAWDPTTNGGKRRIRTYVEHLVSLPDYQLR